MRITNPEVKDALIRALADDYSRKILLSTILKPDSVEGLSRSLDIPISTAYRRVNELVKSTLLTVEKTILTDDGKNSNCTGARLEHSTWISIRERYQLRPS